MNTETLPSMVLPFVMTGFLLASASAIPSQKAQENTDVRIEGNIVSTLACRGICVDSPAPAEIDPWKNQQEPVALPVQEQTRSEKILQNLQRVFRPS